MSSYPPPPAYQQPNAPYSQQPSGEPPLWAPWYGAPFIAALRRSMKKYADFEGRASRSEYWWWVLGVGIVSIVLYFIGIGFVAGGAASLDDSGEGGVTPLMVVGFVIFGIMGLFLLAMIIPSLSLHWRRLHDANLAGPFFFLGFIPGVGWIILLVFTLLPPVPEGQRFDRPRA